MCVCVCVCVCVWCLGPLVRPRQGADETVQVRAARVRGDFLSSSQFAKRGRSRKERRVSLGCC